MQASHVLVFIVATDSCRVLRVRCFSFVSVVPVHFVGTSRFFETTVVSRDLLAKPVSLNGGAEIKPTTNSS